MASPTATLTLDRYSPRARAWVAAAQQLADDHRHVEVQPVHLLSRGLERDPGIATVFRQAGVEPSDVQAALTQVLRRLPTGKGDAFLSSAFLGLMRRAEREAERGGTRLVEVPDLLNALTHAVRGDTAEVLASFKIGPGDLNPHMAALKEAAPSNEAGVEAETSASESLVTDWVELAREGAADPIVGRSDEIRRLLTVLERREKSHPVLVGETGVGKTAILRGLAQRIADGAVPTSLARIRLLDVDLGALTSGSRLRGETEARFKRMILDSGQADQAVFVFRSLGRILGGSPLQPNFGDVLSSLLSKDRVRLLATATPREWQRLRTDHSMLLEWLTPIAVEQPTVDEAIDIVRGAAGRFEKHHRVNMTEAAVVASVQLAKRYLSDRALPDSALDLLDESAAARRVATDGLNPEADEQRVELARLVARKQLIERTSSVDQVELKRIEAAIEELTPKVAEQRRLLDSRREVIESVRRLSRELAQARASRASAKSRNDFARLGTLEHATIPELEAKLLQAELEARDVGVEAHPAQLDETHVAATLAEWTGIPTSRMLEAETDKLLKMEERLSQRVVGQQEAVEALSRAVRRSRAGLRDPARPIGSFLFLGTSGVGKTELAKALAEFLFDDEQALTRLDMSEFMERHMAQRLVGAPPGYADSEQGGFLTEAVRRRPYSVLLFDEVEKAHADVFNLLLQVMDDGRLTDGRGQSADFTNTVIILTSNIGSERIADAPDDAFESEEGRERLKDTLFQTLRDFFRPEFLNRVGDIVAFRPLGKAELRQIVDIQLQRVNGLLSRNQIQLRVSDEAKSHLVDLGYEPALGARPLQRAIVRHIQDPLAVELLRSARPAGATVHVAMRDGRLVFE